MSRDACPATPPDGSGRGVRREFVDRSRTFQLWHYRCVRVDSARKRAGAIGAGVARFVHTEEVTGSNPVSPTLTLPSQSQIADPSSRHRAPVEPSG